MVKLFEVGEELFAVVISQDGFVTELQNVTEGMSLL